MIESAAESEIGPIFRTFDDQRRQTHTEAPILTGFSVVSARSGTVAIESAGEPVNGAVSSELIGTQQARVHVAFSRLRQSLSRIDTAAPIPDFMRRWHRRA